MSNQVIHNLIVLGSVFLIMVLIRFIFLRGWLGLEKVGDSIGLMISRKLFFKYARVIFELLMIITMLGLWLCFSRRSYVILPFILLAFHISISVLSHIRKSNPNGISIFGLISKLPRIDNYATRRFVMFMDQFQSAMSLLLALTFTFAGYTYLKWPDVYYFGLFVAVPVYTNIWIYFNLKIKVNNEDVISMRRIIAYSVFASYIFFRTYTGFKEQFLNVEKLSDFNNFFLNSAYVIFFAIERLLKAWTDDYKKYKANKEQGDSEYSKKFVS